MLPSATLGSVQDSGKRHVFRPLSLALEGRNPVSSLVPGVSATAPLQHRYAYIGRDLQDLYGVESELRIARNKVPLVIQVLAPNQRPIQVTQNLANFWKESYPKLKQELQRKYPKHEWR